MRGKASLASRLLCVVFLLMFSRTAAAGGINYGGGNGTVEDPYLIYTAEQMNAIGADANDWDKHFKLMADIDLGKYKDTDFNMIGYASGWWGSSENKHPFTGVFDGNGKIISNFNYNSSIGKSYIGIFSYIKGATLENIYLVDPNINTDGGKYVGSLVGFSRGTITACHIQGGTVSGSSEVGGLVGNNAGRVTKCASSVTVLGSAAIGGIAGYNQNAIIGDCYSFGYVSGTRTVGGLVGFSGSHASIAYCYSAGKVHGTENVGGLLGHSNLSEILNCFWDIEASGQISSAGGIGKTTAEMHTASTFVGWGPYAVWTINEGFDYPRLLWENMPGELITTPSFPSIHGSGTQDDPYLIYTAEKFNQITLFPHEWDKHFKLMADIDLAGYTAATIDVIGRFTRYPIGGDIPFSGVFDGNGKQILNFTFVQTEDGKYRGEFGMFGYVLEGEIKDLGLINPNIDVRWTRVGSLVGYLRDATISNCYVEGGNVSGDSTVGGLIGRSYRGTIINCNVNSIVSGTDQVGGLAGEKYGTVTNCHFTGEVLGKGQQVGGLVGDHSGTTSDCTASANILGVEKVGGLAGSHMNGRIIHCCATGNVSGEQEVGGLTGGNNGTIINCYATVEVFGSKYVGGFTGQNGLYFGCIVWSGYILNCYATGSVIGETNVGGFVGYNYRWSTIVNCYSTGIVSGIEEVGGLVGQNHEVSTIKAEVINSFWDIETSGLSTSAAGTGKTTAQMQDTNTYINSGWDFEGQMDDTHFTWTEPVNGGYPILWWQLTPLPELPIFSGGTGEPNDPYLITTAEELNSIGDNPRLMNAYFKLMNDTDLSGIDFLIIGKGLFSFAGVFDGNGKTISNFSYNSTEINNIGLFGSVSGVIKDLGLINPNIDAGTGNNVGSFASIVSGTISNCYVQGGSISGGMNVGGLLGKCSIYYTTFSNCYTEDTIVSGSEYVGGLIGSSYAPITNCYSINRVSGESVVGGLVGMTKGLIMNCYSAGTVIGTTNIGGLVGVNRGIVRGSYWDTETSGQSSSAGGTGKTTHQMQSASTFIGWGENPFWTIDDSFDYPRLAWQNMSGESIPNTSYGGGSGTEEDPYLIYSAEQLNWIGSVLHDWNKHFKLMADIDLNELTETSDSIIGYYLTPSIYKPFSGVFDGNGHTISHFSYNSKYIDCIGLFSIVEGENAQIKNLGLIAPNITANTERTGSIVGWLNSGHIAGCYVIDGNIVGDYVVGGFVGSNWGKITDSYVISTTSGTRFVGGLSGSNSGTISKCYANSNVSNPVTSSGSSGFGGLVGQNDGSITNCYAKGNVSANREYIGGLVGYNLGDVRNCYSTGMVSGERGVGGFAGTNTGSIATSFWDIETSGQLISDGGMGKTTAEMQTANTFLKVRWDFVDEIENGTEDIWWILEGRDYPRLWWELNNEK